MDAGSCGGDFDKEHFIRLVNADKYIEALEYSWRTGYSQNLDPESGYEWSRNGDKNLKLPLYNFALMQVRKMAESSKDNRAKDCLRRYVSKKYLDWHKIKLPNHLNQKE